MMPVTESFHDRHFFVRIGGRWHATPMFLALMAIEMSDIVLAVDSVPAISALTKEPLVVFTSNVFAILGLRSLYFVLAAAATKFTLLRFGLAGVLMFIGLKMLWLNTAFGGHVPDPLVAGDHRGAHRGIDPRVRDRRPPAQSTVDNRQFKSSVC